MDKVKAHRLTVAAVWALRIIVGATFMISGTAKMIDPYGFIYKIQQYLAVWGWSVPESLILVTSVTLSAVEFLSGLSLATGSYKRASVWLLAAIMAGMLPLSAYIALADPVDDCGCFGDFLVISNTATLLKNVALTIALAYLLVYNRRIRGLYWPYLQWFQILFGGLYMVIIGVVGYHQQPLIDFRSYKVGTRLMGDVDITDNDELRFIYERDSVRREFAADELPDSTWTYVDRVESAQVVDSDFALYDMADDSDVTEDVADYIADKDVLVLLIPDVGKVSVANTYVINELNSYMELRGGAMIAVVGSDRATVEKWMDLTMAEYPIYRAEATAIKEIARGNMAVVYTSRGVILWKRTLWSVGADLFEKHKSSDWLIRDYQDSGSRWFWMLTTILAGALIVLWGISRSALGLSHHFSQKNEKKNVNLQQIGEPEVKNPDPDQNKDFTNKDKEDLQ